MELLCSKTEERSAPTYHPRALAEGDSIIVHGHLGHIVFTGYAARFNESAGTVEIHTQAHHFTCLGMTLKLSDYRIFDKQGWFSAWPIN